MDILLHRNPAATVKDYSEFVNRTETMRKKFAGWNKITPTIRPARKPQSEKQHELLVLLEELSFLGIQHKHISDHLDISSSLFSQCLYNHIQFSKTFDRIYDFLYSLTIHQLYELLIEKNETKHID